MSDATGGLQRTECFAETLVTDAQGCAQIAVSAGTGLGEMRENALGQSGLVVAVARVRWLRFIRGNSLLDLQANEILASGAGDKMQGHRSRRRSRAMFDGEQQAVTCAGDVEVGVPPGPEITASAKGLPGELSGVLAGVMHQRNGELEATRKVAQSRKDCRYLTDVIFIAVLQSYVGVEHKELGPMTGQRQTKPLEILHTVQSERVFHDQPYIQRSEICVAGSGETLEAAFDLMGSIFGGKHQSRPGSGHCETAKARLPGGDGHRQFQG